jgi:hypothetical protein
VTSSAANTPRRGADTRATAATANAAASIVEPIDAKLERISLLPPEDGDRVCARH